MYHGMIIALSAGDHLADAHRWLGAVAIAEPSAGLIRSDGRIAYMAGERRPQLAGGSQKSSTDRRALLERDYPRLGVGRADLSTMAMAAAGCCGRRARKGQRELAGCQGRNPQLLITAA
jgi:hypothetical protein